MSMLSVSMSMPMTTSVAALGATGVMAAARIYPLAVGGISYMASSGRNVVPMLQRSGIHGWRALQNAVHFTARTGPVTIWKPHTLPA